MSNRSIYLLAAILVLTAGAVFAYKVMVMKLPLTPAEQAELWTVEAEMQFETLGEPVKLTMYMPESQPEYEVLGENFITNRFGRRTYTKGNRRSVWTAKNIKSPQILYYQAVVKKVSDIKIEPAADSIIPSPSDPKLKGIEKSAADTIMKEVADKSADTESMISELLKKLDRPRDDDNVAVLMGMDSFVVPKTRVAAKLLNFVGIPARAAHGIHLQTNQRDVPLIDWLEVYEDGGWKAYNPETAEPERPEDCFIWYYGQSPIARIKGGENLEFNISTSRRANTAAVCNDRGNEHFLMAFSPFNLPIRTQSVYQVLLTVPIGVIILVFLRNIIGIKTFGTFMPILVALAFRETHLLWGVCLFTTVVGLGLMVRSILAKFRLLLVPRLACLLTIVVMIMLSISILSHALGIPTGLSVALFPMIILTMTIERMSIVWEERGAPEAIMQGFGSLLIAVITYPIIISPLIEHLVFYFPELLLVVIAAGLIMGRYCGYRLSELTRFKAMSHDNT